MKYPKLYKQTATGKIQEWDISTDGNKIIVVQGQVDGKKQRYVETIKEGKNIGRANETTPEYQADLEATSKWKKKHDKDYHIVMADCKGTTKIANLGGYLPMLAHSFQKHAKRHLTYPCFVQPKLDGLRCIATKDKEGVKLWFRSGKEVVTMGHIVKDLEKVMQDGDIFDGELYIHGEDFNSFTGAIRANKNLNPEITEKIKYHMYDYPRINGLTEKDGFNDRFPKSFPIPTDPVEATGSIISVKTYLIGSFEEAMKLYEILIDDGYEGIMFRNKNMPYEQKRSHSLLKYKEFIDDEFIIIGAEEGKGILAGHVGSFICKIEDGKVLKDLGDKEFVYRLDKDSRTEKQGKGTVSAKLDGKTKYLKHLFENPEEYMGKPLTIKYQNLSKDGIPRFPVGKGIRFDK